MLESIRLAVARTGPLCFIGPVLESFLPALMLLS
jgi:hypothetical protein